MRWPCVAWWHDRATTPRSRAALDANFADLIRWYASRPGGEVVEAADVTMCSTGLAFRSINCAVAIDLDACQRRSADRRGRRLVRGARRRRGAGSWARPAGLSTSGSDSSRAGFELVSDAAGMALDLVGFEPEPAPAGVEIVTVDDLAGLDAWEELQRRALSTRRRDGHTCVARRSRPRAQQRGRRCATGSRSSTASRSRRQRCSSRPASRASTTSRPCRRLAVVASAAP